jgi:hypothetical protein
MIERRVSHLFPRWFVPVYAQLPSVSAMRHRSRFVSTVGTTVAGALLIAACSSASSDADADSPNTNAADSASETDTDAPPDDTEPNGANDTTPPTDPPAPRPRFRYPPAPTAPVAEVQSAADGLSSIDAINEMMIAWSFDVDSVIEVGKTGDIRHGWYLADLLRFFGGENGEIVVEAFETLAGIQITADPESAVSPWLSVTNHLIAWDTPDYPGYREDKASIFLRLESGWEPFFTDENAEIDWRVLSWGGVLIDDRELGDNNFCIDGCIPALDDPATTDAEGGDWYPDEMIVFGLVEGDEALAFPKNIAEIHEMFNFTLGGRRFGLPYCTLCGSAQAYYTDNSGAAEEPVLRTSGLLTRSNKVMYDFVTKSVFDTFTGDAVSGPLHDQGVSLEQTTLVRSTWGEWKVAHPETQIISESGGIGRSYPLDPLRGRDDRGPIFPIGNADDRLDVQELVVGVITADGTPIAFPSDLASEVLGAGGDVSLGGISLVEDGDGLRAVDDATGDEVSAHEAFWFAWSQFHTDTELFAT